jgi:hypothetical protein
MLLGAVCRKGVCEWEPKGSGISSLFSWDQWVRGRKCTYFASKQDAVEFLGWHLWMGITDWAIIIFAFFKIVCIHCTAHPIFREVRMYS